MRRDDPGPYSLDALRALPKPALFSRDAAALKVRYIVWFEQASGRALYPMQVEMLLIETLAYAMSILGEEAQMTVEQHLVALATVGLDQLGANRSAPRLPASKARVTMRFSLTTVRQEAVTIPEQNRVNAGSAGLVFLTLTPAVIPAGALWADVTAEASLEGVAGNGLQPGHLTSMLDPVAGVVAANVTTSEGGADIEDLDQWRLRIANAFDRVSSAGGKG
ncbi:baseplate J/gp47 family protein [Labrys sp. 22185]|uniref:baseplate J/gp47 family protein n=1 Tax=Labrys sp. 22185 TaxID=3453888 RepID=UPI003F82B7AF